MERGVKDQPLLSAEEVRNLLGYRLVRRFEQMAEEAERASTPRMEVAHCWRQAAHVVKIELEDLNSEESGH